MLLIVNCRVAGGSQYCLGVSPMAQSSCMGHERDVLWVTNTCNLVTRNRPWTIDLLFQAQTINPLCFGSGLKLP